MSSSISCIYFCLRGYLAQRTISASPGERLFIIASGDPKIDDHFHILKITTMSDYWVILVSMRLLGVFWGGFNDALKG